MALRLLVLTFVFASFIAIVPLLMAIVAIPTTFLLIWPLATVTDVSVIVKFLVALIGLAIAIDYALLVVVRWREERLRPETSNDAAVVKAMQHAGRPSSSAAPRSASPFWRSSSCRSRSCAASALPAC